jgi:hypothetical protein
LSTAPSRRTSVSGVSWILAHPSLLSYSLEHWLKSLFILSFIEFLENISLLLPCCVFIPLEKYLTCLIFLTI